MIPTTHVHVLDRAVASSLDGHHVRFARRHGHAVRYQTDVATFAALDDPNDPRAWDEAVHLLEPDVPFVVPGVTLIARTDPGPYRQRTIELGTYLGIRRESALIAMAGERLHPTGWTEISAVCTDPAYRGQGLAGRLVRAVAAGIFERGETPFLHAAATNESALRLYEKLGFTLRRTMPIALLTHKGSVG